MEVTVQNLEDAGIISPEQAEAIRIAQREEQEHFSEMLRASNERARQKYVRLPLWRRFLDGEAYWVSKHRDFFPL